METLLAICERLETVFPNATIEKQVVPKKQEIGLIVVRQLSQKPNSETRQTYRVDGEYEIIQFSQSQQTLLTNNEMLIGAFENDSTLGDGSRISYTAISQAFETEDKVFGCIAVIATSKRVVRDTPVYEKMGQIHFD